MKTDSFFQRYLLCCFFVIGFLAIGIGSPDSVHGQILKEPLLLSGASGLASFTASPSIMSTPDGFVVLWFDNRRGDNTPGNPYRDLYAQKFDTSGNLFWGESGRVVAAGPADGLSSYKQEGNYLGDQLFVRDNAAGIITCWNDSGLPSDQQVWATHLNENGDVAWGNPAGTGIQGDDTAVLVLESTSIASRAGLAPDGEGGMFVGFYNTSWGDWAIHRYDATGVLRADTATGGQRGHNMRCIYGEASETGQDSVIVAWREGTGGGPLKISKYSDPETAHTGGGVDRMDNVYTAPIQISPETYGVDADFGLISDGSGGAYITWSDQRNGFLNAYIQHIDADGNKLWGEWGVALYEQSADQSDTRICPDGLGGYVIAWTDNRANPAQIYAQRIDSEGDFLWDIEGIAVSTLRGSIPRLVSAEDQTTIVIWHDNDANGGTPDELRAQKIDSDGNLRWDPDGVAIYTGVMAEYDVVSDGEAGVIAVYPKDNKLYATQLPGNGTLDVGTYLRLYGPDNTNVGEKEDFLIVYKNGEGGTMEDAVVILNLPLTVDYMTSSHDGIFYPEKNYVFWRLGDLPDDAQGKLWVQVEVPWGVPAHTPQTFSAGWGATNIDSSIDVTPYLSYQPLTILTTVKLSAAQIDAFLAADPEATVVFNYALSEGYEFHDIGYRLELSSGEEAVVLGFIDLKDWSFVTMTKTAKSVFMERFDDTTYAIFDQDGGITYDILDGSYSGWGEWAEIHSPSKAQCMFNCIMSKIPEHVIKKKFELIDNITKAKDIVENLLKCQEGANQQSPDMTGCVDAYQKALEELLGKIPGFDIGQALGECNHDCNSNTESHVCYKDSVTCSKCSPLTGNAACRKTRKCSNGAYSWFADSVPCSNIQGSGCYGQIGCGICNGDECTCIKAPNEEACNKIQALAANDPNAKTGPLGDVVPGQNLTYNIYYENTGEGTAYDVYITDTLDDNLDAGTLVIENGGKYFNNTRNLFWSVGNLTAGGKGAVTFQIQVEGGISSGTLISNQAVIHFPSSHEITPTNVVVNMVKDIAAFSQSLKTEENTALPVTLDGRDSGGAPLSYTIVKEPINGGLTGTPPNLTYTPAENFEGVDHVLFKVNNGSVDSDPAYIDITVLPSPGDTTPPEVTNEIPANGDTHVLVYGTPYNTDPDVYLPYIAAYFNKPIDPESLDASSFKLEKSDGTPLTGEITWDSSLWAAVFFPHQSLEYNTTYTATLGTTIHDLSGNYLADNYVWSFTTLDADTVLQLTPGIHDFGEIESGVLSEAKTAYIYNFGTLPLTLDSITLQGGNPGDFSMFCGGEGDSLMAPSYYPVKIWFQPTSLGVKTAELAVTSGSTTQIVTLTGTGIEGGGAGSPGTLQFSAGTYEVNEGDGTATITVTRTGGCDGNVSVDFAAGDGSATAGSDYASTSGNLSWTDGESVSRTFDIPLITDTAIEPSETVNLSLSNPQGAELGNPDSAVLTINDDDGAIPTMTEWGLIFLAVFIALTSSYYLRKKQTVK